MYVHAIVSAPVSPLGAHRRPTRRLSLWGLLAIALGAAGITPARSFAGDAAQPAAAPDTSSVDARLRRLEEENEALRRRVETLDRWRYEQGEETSGEDLDRAEGDLSDRDGDAGPQSTDSVQEQARRQERQLPTRGGLYNKPFLRNVASSIHLGGYFDLEYRDAEGGDRRFDQGRLIPFIFADLPASFRFGTEIEFEHGGPDSPGGEVKVEFAALDWVLSEAFSLRAGALLVPLGRFNLTHDTPVNDLTDRPLVDQLVIPTTFTEAGAGAFGTIYPFGETRIDYELYLVNGMQGLEERGGTLVSRIDRSRGLRDARPGLKFNNNNAVSAVGRLAVSPVLGSELGVSAHVGPYDPRGRNLLAIYAADLVVQPGRFIPALGAFELLGEVARAEIERDDTARAAGVPGDLWGAYLQVNFHFMFDTLEEALPSVFGSESTFTAVVRLGHVDLDRVRRERATLGLNFRPVEDTVLKLSYQLNLEDWAHDREQNDAFVASVASYF